MAGRASYEQENDAPGLAREMRLLRRERTGQRCGRGATALAKERAERDGAEAHAALLEKPAARDQLRIETAVEMRLAVHGRASKSSFSSDSKSCVNRSPCRRPRLRIHSRYLRRSSMLRSRLTWATSSLNSWT